MTMGVFDFKAIKRKLDCQEQKAEFEEKNPPVDMGMYGYPSNLTPMKSLAHPAWPYTGTPHEWRIKI
jgi:hypothetical protein